MMCQQLFLAAIVLVAVSDLCHAELDPEKLKMMKPFMDTCIKESGVTPELLAKLHKEHDVPTIKEGKCFIACMTEQMKLMKDGKFDKDMVGEFVDKLVADADKAKEIKSTLEECIEKHSDVTDKCELAAEMATCMKDHHQELMGIN